MDKELKQALSVGGADYLEIRIEDAATTSVTYIGKELENIGESSSLGGCVRAAVNGGWGFASFNSLENLADKAKRAVSMARQVGREKTTLTPTEPYEAKHATLPGRDPRQVPLEEKHDTAHRYNQLILRANGIQTSSVRYQDRWKRKVYANSDGTTAEFEEIFCGVSLAAIARKGNIVQTYHHTYGNLVGFDEVTGREALAEDAAHRAVDLVSAERVKGGTYTVLMDPILTGIFIHEAFGHLSESDFLYENPRLQEVMQLGRRFGPEILNVVDQGNLNQAGYLPFDDEGTRTKKNDLIRDGVLVGRLHSRETAAKMNETPTGNARAISYRFPPIVRMTNTFIEAGETSYEEMLARIDRGIYVKNALAGMTDCEMFTFTGMEAFEIENGRIGKRLRDVTLTGNVFETLKNVVAVGNDLSFHAGLGGCGKGGQSPLRVSAGGPHLLVENVVVGGE
ncbi:MAG TPA: TldD/PmbA family protein [bacterium]|nr:TldD/PmbA family protein [bacterium]HPO08930.1 TldD/PmbA family protein [bacterium]HQQ00246.1 TldD/PmbA family protein [bacterium]